VLGPVTLAGVLCLAAGVISLAFDRKAGFSTNPKVIFYALMTAACIASYTVVDGVGVRTSGSILGFAVWLTVGDGLLTAILVFGWKGRAAWRVARQNLGTAFLGGAMQVGAYWIIVWALALAPMAMVSALRETSVLFAAVISAFLLKEGFGVWRFVSASLVTLGLILWRSEK
jgi:drug/metabolite transporter (DMT)-like permease